jgi:quercetin dioxygenase-like cupin family protein
MDESPAINTVSMTYQPGAVISKSFLKKAGGSVTLFAFDEGQELSEHTAPFDALVHILEGQAEITVSGIVSVVSSGEILLMPSNEPHALKAVTPFTMMLVMIKP